VAETGAGEVLAGEFGRDAPPLVTPNDDHFGVRASVEDGIWPERRVVLASG
jgi:hypothetical protein